jgi:uncharacterized protein
MGIENKFYGVFKIKKPVIGMIHLAGNNFNEKINNAIKELEIYGQEGVDGAIIEDYHGGVDDVYETIKKTSSLGLNISLGLNVLRDPYVGFTFAKKFGARFVQFDSVQSNYIDTQLHEIFKEQNKEIVVLGGIGFKYTSPSGNSLERDLEDGKKMCDGIVTTGEGTGIETPLEKLKLFKKYLKDFPLIVGAGINDKNCYEQLQISDGAIVGSYFKPNKNTQLLADKYLVRNLMDVVKEVRKDNL